MRLSEELQQRGFIQQHTGETLSEVVDGTDRTVYLGIDPTAESAHIGNLVTWLLLRHLSKAGHKVIFLVGGGTGMIGDPKPDVERPLMPPEEVEARAEKLALQARKVLGSDDITFVNNHKWLATLNLIDFLRDIGKHFTVGELIKKDAISARLEGETGLSYTEFAYPLLQAYDYLQLHQQYQCDLQVGGSDQWGNIVAGVDLIRRKEGTTVHAITVPLVLDKATGKKFGKSEGNAIWLDESLTSPYQFYQFWLNVSDESVIDFLKLYTLLDLEEVEAIATEFEMNPGGRSAQRTLAREVTKLVHPDALESVERVSNTLFGESDLDDLTKEELEMLRENAPFSTVRDGTALVDVLVESGLATSKREARTFIESGAISLNGSKRTEEMNLKKDELPRYNLLKRGKRHMTVVEIA